MTPTGYDGRLKVILKRLQNWLPAPKVGFLFNGSSTLLIDGNYNNPGVVRME